MILYEPEGLEDAVLRRFVRWSIGQGTRILVTSPVVRERLSSELLGGLNAGRWVFTYDLESFSIRKAPALATLVIAGLTDHLPGEVATAFRWNGRGKAKVEVERTLLAPTQTLDPARRSHTLRDTTHCQVFMFGEFIKRIGL